MTVRKRSGLLLSDLQKMAKAATQHGVPIEMQDNSGRIFRVYPSVEALSPATAMDDDIAYGGNSLEEWRNRKRKR